MRALAPLVLLLALAPAVGGAPAELPPWAQLPTPHADVALRLVGFDTGAAYAPLREGHAVGFLFHTDVPVEPHILRVPDLVPREQWLWMEVELRERGSGAPLAGVDVRPYTVGFGDGFVQDAKTDAQGRARILLQPPVADRPSIWIWTGSTYHRFEWVAGPPLPDATVAQVFAPRGEWIALELEILEPTRLDVRFTGTSPRAPAQKANAVYFHERLDIVGRARPLDLVASGAWQDLRELDVTLAPGVKADADTALTRHFGGGAFWMGWHGYAAPGQLSGRFVIGRAGMDGAEDGYALAVFGARGAYRLTEVARGPFHVAGGEAEDIHVGSLAGDAQMADAYSITLDVPARPEGTLVLASVGGERGDRGHIRLARDEQARDDDLEWWPYFDARRAGACEGAWSLRVSGFEPAASGFEGGRAPSVALAVAEGIPLPAWLVDAYGGPGCPI